nr:MAG TPA: Protein of unknown function (DUF1353) [Ackermannviridae sp.]
MIPIVILKAKKIYVYEDIKRKVGIDTTIQIPRGFVSDGASIPRFLWTIFPPFHRWTDSAIIHDFLYKTQFIDRKVCDKIFLECMLEDGVNKIVAYLFYFNVRVFGKFAWEKHTKSK